MLEWWPFLLFVAAGVLLTFLGNLWGPLLVSRARVRSRKAWAADHGFTFGGGSEAERFITEKGRPGLFALCRNDLYFDVLRSSDTAVVDFAYVRELGGTLQSERSDVRKAATVALTSVDRPLPSALIRPWGKRRAAQLAIDRLPTLSQVTDDVLQGLFATIETGDPAFDDTFQVSGRDEHSIRALLTPDVRVVMVRLPAAQFELDGRSVLGYEERILSADDLSRLVDVVNELTGALERSVVPA